MSTATTETILEVHELGEDSDSWLIAGTTPDTQISLVKLEVAKWILDTRGVDDLVGETIDALANDAQFVYRDDWVYVPVHAAYPDEECFLRYGDDASADLPRFSGTQVRI